MYAVTAMDICGGSILAAMLAFILDIKAPVWKQVLVLLRLWASSTTGSSPCRFAVYLFDGFVYAVFVTTLQFCFDVPLF